MAQRMQSELRGMSFDPIIADLKHTMEQGVAKCGYTTNALLLAWYPRIAQTEIAATRAHM
jgi:hypothetical protein